MKTGEPNPALTVMLLIMTCTLATFVCPVGAQTDGYLLMVQPSPADAGTVTPQTGIFRTSLNDSVTLTALPKTGYRFVCWLGDVGNPTANSTTILVDAPKIVIAVFEREEFEALSEEGALLAPARGYTALRASPSRIRAGAGISPGEPKIYDTPDYPGPKPPDKPDDFPIPDVPEPATILILGLGAFGVLSARRRPVR